ncbi:MAG: hypothetical protein ACR2PH_15590, partial [Desulfobulbia bacterium]
VFGARHEPGAQNENFGGLFFSPLWRLRRLRGGLQGKGFFKFPYLKFPYGSLVKGFGDGQAKSLKRNGKPLMKDFVSYPLCSFPMGV